MWKKIIGFENYYVSEFGQIFSIKSSKVLKPSKNTDGYLIVCLCKDKKKYIKRIHRLVAIAFMSNLENKKEVDHIDGNKENNCVGNLRWASACENNQNRKVQKNNKLGIKNICYHKCSDRYIFKKIVNKKKLQVDFKTLEESIQFKNKWYDENSTKFMLRN